MDRQDLELTGDSLLRMAADIVSAYVSKNTLSTQQIPEVIASVFTTLSDLRVSRPSASLGSLEPAVPIRKSIMPDYLICLEDGKHLKMLKRHLRAAYNMSPEEYRTRWNLPQDYPMVAPNYAKARSKFAKDIGLGRRASVARLALDIGEVRAPSIEKSLINKGKRPSSSAPSASHGDDPDGD